MKHSEIYTAVCLEDGCPWDYCDFSVKNVQVLLDAAKLHTDKTGHTTAVDKRKIGEKIETVGYFRKGEIDGK